MINRRKHPPRKEQAPAEKAFSKSDKHVLDDLKLQPWTPDRIIKANELGFSWPNIGKEGFTHFRKTNLYPGVLRDVLIFVALASTNPENIESVTWEEAKAAGVKRRIHTTDSKLFWAAYMKMLEVHDEIANSLAVPKGDHLEPPDDEDDDPKD